MGLNAILQKIDHTNLSVTSSFKNIQNLCDEAIKFNAASVCIAPCYIKETKEYVKDKIKICTVIGFPNGYNTSKIKLLETINSLDNGADEIDFVINIGKLKDKDYEYVSNEILSIKKICDNKILKVIIETCLLTESEKIEMCKIVSKNEADYIKTSTGFSKFGADLQDIILFKKHLASHVKIKAAGGIRTVQEAQKFIEAGADRIGASKIISDLAQK